MRTMLRLGTIGVALALGCAGAKAAAPGYQAADPYAGYNEQLLTANSFTPATAGRSAFTTVGSGADAATETRGADRTPRSAAKAGLRNFILFAAAALVAGFVAAGAVAVRILDGREFSPGEVANQTPYGLLRANLAILDSLMRGYSARGT